jgi:hypothetical protein
MGADKSCMISHESLSPRVLPDERLVILNSFLVSCSPPAFRRLGLDLREAQAISVPDTFPQLDKLCKFENDETVCKRR